MAAFTQTTRRNVPAWAIVAVAVVSIGLFGYFGWKAAFGRDGEVGPPKKVYPGMYDLRAEAAKMRAAKEQEGAQNGP